MLASFHADTYSLASELLLGWKDSDQPDPTRNRLVFTLRWVGRKLYILANIIFRYFIHVVNVLLRLRFRHRFKSIVYVTIGGTVTLIGLTAIFWPSYTHLPPHYKALKDRVQTSGLHGRGNIENQKIYIAAALYDPEGEIANGQWGQALVELIQLLGNENVFLSIYESNSGQAGEDALHALAGQLACNKSIVSEPGLSLGRLPRITIPGGAKRIRRIDYLVDARNRALNPLQQAALTYDKLLYLNDVIFDPVDALQLLFSTNADPNGVAQYRAACAVDFSNAFKFYDSYATRDLRGYGIGLPFYPWFTSAGNAESRQDVLEGRDAVRVRGCWGGMVAFDATFFQGPDPVRFRVGSEIFWDASECCIIHADIQGKEPISKDPSHSGSYMNPFVRVAYDSRSHSWLRVTRRFEKLYPFIHGVLSHLVGFPRSNPRRTEVPGQKIMDTIWVSGDGEGALGEVERREREAENDGYCGRRGLEVLVEDRKPGQDGFEAVQVPAGLV